MVYWDEERLDWNGLKLLIGLEPIFSLLFQQLNEEDFHASHDQNQVSVSLPIRQELGRVMMSSTASTLRCCRWWLSRSSPYCLHSQPDNRNSTLKDTTYV